MANIHKLIEVPESSRLFFCTDVHGRLDNLMGLLREVKFSDNDYLISIGDLIDRGPKSLETLNMFINPNRPNLHALLGNHEYMLMQKDLHNLFYNGGQWALDQSDETIDYLSRKISEKMFFSFTVRKGDYIIACTHAEVPEEYEYWDDFLNDLFKTRVKNEAVWGREFLVGNIQQRLYGSSYVLHGHSRVPKLKRLANRLYFDTGSTMTLLEFDNGNFKEIRMNELC